MRGLPVASLDIAYESSVEGRMNPMDLTTDAGMALLSCIGKALPWSNGECKRHTHIYIYTYIYTCI